jgi:hypothetical protein
LSIITQVLLIGLLFAAGYLVVVFQVLNLSQIYKHRGWYVLAASFTLAGGLQAYQLAVRMPSGLLKAQMRGTLPESLSIEQWVLVGLALLVIVGLIVGFDLLRRGLRNLGF